MPGFIDTPTGDDGSSDSGSRNDRQPSRRPDSNVFLVSCNDIGSSEWLAMLRHLKGETETKGSSDVT